MQPLQITPTHAPMPLPDYLASLHRLARESAEAGDLGMAVDADRIMQDLIDKAMQRRPQFVPQAATIPASGASPDGR